MQETSSGVTRETNKKKILVSGCAGFLGSHLADRLLADGHEVIGVDNLLGGEMENVPKGVKFYKEDTADILAMNWVLAHEEPEIVYHCACIACEGFSVFSPAFITQNTFGNTLAILSSSIRYGVKRFIYTSSMSRYGKQACPFTEDMTPAPEDPYAVAKVACENTLKLLSETHGFEYVIAIPHNIVGVRQKYDDPFRNVASIMINRIMQGKAPIIYGDGLQTRSFSFIDDCIDSMVRMIDCPSGGVYNIGPDDKDGTVYSVKMLAEEIADLMGYKGEFIYVPDRPREVKHAYCSSDKIRTEFGFKAKKSLREGLKEMIDDIKLKGAKEFKYDYPVEIINDKTPRTWVDKLI